MLAVVKKRRTNKRLFEIRGDIPQNTIKYLKKEFGSSFEILQDENELIDIFKTDWFSKIHKNTRPGDSIKIYRQNHGLTQAELGEKLGHLTKQNISDMENGRRGISKNTAKKLSAIFDVPVERFL
jgi:DNA-binding XRE family transcriptional regulator